MIAMVRARLRGGNRGICATHPPLQGAPETTIICFKQNTRLKNCHSEAIQEGHSVSILFSSSGQGTLYNFPEILLKLSLPHMMNICKIWMKPVKIWHDYKAF